MADDYPQPNDHPWKHHPWNFGKEGKKAHLKLESLDPQLIDGISKIKEATEHY